MTAQEAASMMGAWNEILYIFDNPDVQKTMQIVADRRKKTKVFPDTLDTFAALRECKYKDVKITLILQD